ncbi:MAG: radical SAM protein [Planctomycetes bacterium]|nr:radical SAM protein [Planctomycetota bacterium]
MNKSHLVVTEIFKSIQGESSHAGIPCTFVRLTGCNLRCTYCDTSYAYDKGVELSLETIEKKVADYCCKNVCVTGGEPLLQENVHELIKMLLQLEYNVFVETNGSVNISLLPENVIRIMDIKCPDSRMHEKMDWNNINRLRPDDEVKFIISSEDDYEWVKQIIISYNLTCRSNVLFGVVYGTLESGILAELILRDKLNVRLQLQLHRYIWPDKTRGV